MVRPTEGSRTDGRKSPFLVVVVAGLAIALVVAGAALVLVVGFGQAPPDEISGEVEIPAAEFFAISFNVSSDLTEIYYDIRVESGPTIDILFLTNLDFDRYIAGLPVQDPDSYGHNSTVQCFFECLGGVLCAICAACLGFCAFSFGIQFFPCFLRSLGYSCRLVYCCYPLAQCK